jgi:hypothetical protein
LNLVRFFFVTGTSREIFLCCEANGRDVDKSQCRQIHKIQGHAIGCISSKHVSVFFSCKNNNPIVKISNPRLGLDGIDVNKVVTLEFVFANVSNDDELL